MGKRRPQETEYDPVASDLARDVRLAVAPVTASPRPEPIHVTDVNEHPVAVPLKAKRYKVTPDEDVALARLVLRLQEASGTKVNLSLLNRIGNTLLMDAADEVVDGRDLGEHVVPDDEVGALTLVRQLLTEIGGEKLRERRNALLFRDGSDILRRLNAEARDVSFDEPP